MLSQTLPNEMVVPTTSIFMPQRVKYSKWINIITFSLVFKTYFFLLSRSVYVKLVEDARNSRLDELNRIKNSSDSAESSRSDVNFIRLLSDMKLHNI